MKTDSYEQKEIIGRQKMESLINKLFGKYTLKVEFDTYKYAPKDVRIDFLDDNNQIFKTIVAEIKVRDNYKNSEELMLELDKYNRLMHEAMFCRRDELIADVKTWYVNFIDDKAVIFSFNPKDKHEVFKIWCRENNVSSTKVEKDIIFLNKNNAKVIKY